MARGVQSLANSVTTTARGVQQRLDRHIAQLASTTPAYGASTVGVEDSGGLFTGTTVEAVLAELAAGVGITDVSAAAATTVVMAAGAVTVTQTYHNIDTSGGASEDLNTVNGVANGQFYILRNLVAGRNVVLKHGTGNILCPNGQDITLDVTNDKVWAFSDGVSLFVLDATLATAVNGGLTKALAAAGGAGMVGITDAGGYFAATTVEAALQETRADLAAVTNGNGASLVGIEDALALYTGTTVEAALAEIRTLIDSKAATELTIDVAGNIALTQTYHTIDTLGDIASDDLDSVTGLVDGAVYFFRNEAVGRAVVFRSGVGGIICPGNGDITMTAAGDTVMAFGYGGFLVCFPFVLSNLQGGGLGLQLISSAPGLGASKIGVADAGLYFAGSTVEASLAEVGAERASNVIADPGDAGAIAVTKSGAVPIVTGGAETRTLAIPTFIGQEMSVYMQTFVGVCVITVASAFNLAGNTTITLGAANQSILLKGAWNGVANVWRVVQNDGTVLG